MCSHRSTATIFAGVVVPYSPVGSPFLQCSAQTNFQEAAMPRKTANAPTADIGSQELTEAIVRIRAYQLFEQRGYEHGHDIEDWLRAEAEVTGKKTASADQAERGREAAAAA
jgi:Protein of unknown function (DUF2934)